MILARFSVTCCFSCVCFWKFMLLFEIDYSSGRAVFVIVGYLKAVVIVGYLEAVGGRPSRSKWGGQSQFPSPSASTCLEEASPTHASPFHPSTLRSSSTSSTGSVCPHLLNQQHQSQQHQSQQYQSQQQHQSQEQHQSQ